MGCLLSSTTEAHEYEWELFQWPSQSMSSVSCQELLADGTRLRWTEGPRPTEAGGENGVKGMARG